MSVIVNTNSSAIAASNNLSRSNAMLQQSLNRLSSGSKIVSPSDDAGGLAVGMKMQAAIKRYSATNQNLANAQSYLQTQDSAFASANQILNRISELSVLAADVTKNAADRELYNTEFQQLKEALWAIEDESYNGIPLFSDEPLKVQLSPDGIEDRFLEIGGNFYENVENPAFEPIDEDFSTDSDWSDVSAKAKTASVQGQLVLDGSNGASRSNSTRSVTGAFEMNFDFELTDTSSPFSVLLGESGELFSFSSNTNANSARIVFDGTGTSEVYLNGEGTPSITRSGVWPTSGELRFQQADGGKTTVDNVEVVSTPRFDEIDDTFDAPSGWIDQSYWGSSYVDKRLNFYSDGGAASVTGSSTIEGAFEMEFDLQLGAVGKDFKAFLGSSEIFSYAADTNLNRVRIEYDGIETAKTYINGVSSSSQTITGISDTSGAIKFLQSAGGGTTKIDDLSISPNFNTIVDDFETFENWTSASSGGTARARYGKLMLDSDRGNAGAKTSTMVEGAFQMSFDFQLEKVGKEMKAYLGDSEIFSYAADTNPNSVIINFDGIETAKVFLNGSSTPAQTIAGISDPFGAIKFLQSSGGGTTEIDNLAITSVPDFATITDSFYYLSNWTDDSAGGYASNVHSSNKLSLESHDGKAVATSKGTVDGPFEMNFDLQLGAVGKDFKTYLGASEIFSYSADTNANSVRIVFDGVDTAQVYLNGNASPDQTITGISDTSGAIQFFQDLNGGTTSIDNLSIVSASIPGFATVDEKFDDFSNWTDDSPPSSAVVSSGSMNLNSANGVARTNSVAQIYDSFEMEFDFQLGKAGKEFTAYYGGNGIFSYSADTNAHSARIVFDGYDTAQVYLDGSASPSQTITGITDVRDDIWFRQEAGGGTTTIDNLHAVSTPLFDEFDQNFSESDNWTDDSILPYNEVTGGQLKLYESVAVAKSTYSLSGPFEMNFDFQLQSTASPLQVTLGDSSNNEIFSFSNDTSAHTAKIVFDGTDTAEVYLDGSATATSTLTGVSSNSGIVSFLQSTGGTTTSIDNLSIVSTSGTPAFSTINESFGTQSDWDNGDIAANVSVNGGRLTLNSKNSVAQISPLVVGPLAMEFEYQTDDSGIVLSANLGTAANNSLFANTGDTALHGARIEHNGIGTAKSYLDGSDTIHATKNATLSSSTARVSFEQVAGRGSTTIDNLSIVPDSIFQEITAAENLSDLSTGTTTSLIQQIATFRARNGSQQSRLQFASEQLTTTQQNLEAANSRILDVDVAEESTQLARANILVQAGAAMLRQANASSQVALKLLG